MGLRFGDDVRLADAVALKGKSIAAVGVGADKLDPGAHRLYFAVERDGRGDAFADVMRNNATRSPAISTPYDGALLFF